MIHSLFALQHAKPQPEPNRRPSRWSSRSRAPRHRASQNRASQNRASRRGGSVIVIVSLSLIVLLGFSALAVDYGMLVSDANRLQRACDASALAGATQLKKTGNDVTDVANARQAATDMMAQYKIAGFDPNTITFSPLFNRITVPANATRNYFFAGAFKLINPNSPATGRVARQAIAGRAALRGVPAASPLAITTTDYLAFKGGIAFEDRLIDNNRQDFVPTTMVALDLRLGNSGKSPAIFENDLTYGTPGTTIIGQAVNNSLNASLNAQGAKMQNAIDARIEQAKAAPWNDTGSTYNFPDYPSDDPRIITIMVADPNPADNSNPMITARYFVSVYIEGFRSDNIGTFLQMRILPVHTFSSDRTGLIVGDDGTPFTGPSVIGLSD